MNSRRFVLAGLIGSLAATAVTRASAQAPSFRAGQAWTLNDERYQGAEVIIGRVEKVGPLSVVHVSVLRVPLKGQVDGGEIITFGHMPFLEDAVRRSVGKKIRDRGGAHDGFQRGYAEWSAARGGVFTVTIPEALAVSLQMITPDSTAAMDQAE